MILNFACEVSLDSPLQRGGCQRTLQYSCYGRIIWTVFMVLWHYHTMIFLWYGKTAWTLFMGLWMPLSYMKVMNIDRERSLFIATSMNTYHYDQWSWLEAMNIDRYDHCSYWFMHECAVHAMKGYWSCMKTVDHSYEQALIMHDNVHIHVIMNIIVTPTRVVIKRGDNKVTTPPSPGYSFHSLTINVKTGG